MSQKQKIVLVRTSVVRQAGIDVRAHVNAHTDIAAIGLVNTKTRLIDGFILPCTTANKAVLAGLRGDLSQPADVSEEGSLSHGLWLVGRNHAESGGCYGRGRKQASKIVHHVSYGGKFVPQECILISNDHLSRFLPGRGRDAYRLVYCPDDIAEEHEVEAALWDILETFLNHDAAPDDRVSARAPFFGASFEGRADRLAALAARGDLTVAEFEAARGSVIPGPPGADIV